MPAVEQVWRQGPWVGSAAAVGTVLAAVVTEALVEVEMAVVATVVVATEEVGLGEGARGLVETVARVVALKERRAAEGRATLLASLAVVAATEQTAEMVAVPQYREAIEAGAIPIVQRI